MPIEVRYGPPPGQVGYAAAYAGGGDTAVRLAQLRLQEQGQLQEAQNQAGQLAFRREALGAQQGDQDLDRAARQTLQDQQGYYQDQQQRQAAQQLQQRDVMQQRFQRQQQERLFEQQQKLEETRQGGRNERTQAVTDRQTELLNTRLTRQEEMDVTRYRNALGELNRAVESGELSEEEAAPHRERITALLAPLQRRQAHAGALGGEVGRDQLQAQFEGSIVRRRNPATGRDEEFHYDPQTRRLTALPFSHQRPAVTIQDIVHLQTAATQAIINRGETPDRANVLGEMRRLHALADEISAPPPAPPSPPPPPPVPRPDPRMAPRQPGMGPPPPAPAGAGGLAPAQPPFATAQQLGLPDQAAPLQAAQQRLAEQPWGTPAQNQQALADIEAGQAVLRRFPDPRTIPSDARRLLAAAVRQLDHMAQHPNGPPAGPAPGRASAERRGSVSQLLEMLGTQNRGGATLPE